jgi:hypothetical protein
MGVKKRFTPEEVRQLSDNPYTLSVTENRISFTLEAKKKILELFGLGKSLRQTLTEMGYDVEVLGHGRMKSIIKNIQAEAESEEGLHQGYKREVKRKQLSTEELNSLGVDEMSVIKLRNEVVYLRAEVEFLKKISQEAISGKRGK